MTALRLDSNHQPLVIDGCYDLWNSRDFTPAGVDIETWARGYCIFAIYIGDGLFADDDRDSDREYLAADFEFIVRAHETRATSDELDTLAHDDAIDAAEHFGSPRPL